MTTLNSLPEYAGLILAVCRNPFDLRPRGPRGVMADFLLDSGLCPVRAEDARHRVMSEGRVVRSLYNDPPRPEEGFDAYFRDSNSWEWAVGSGPYRAHGGFVAELRGFGTHEEVDDPAYFLDVSVFTQTPITALRL